jgi:hypothetical protein
VPSLRVDCVWGELNAVRLALVLRGDEREVLRPPRSAVADSASRKGLILPGTFIFQALAPLSSALDFQCIIDTGCEAFGVIGFELVPEMVRSKAESPIRLIGAGSNSLRGGTHCIRGAFLLPVFSDGEYVRARCPDAVFYIADIGPRAIVGYPLLARYGLAVVPGKGTLVFDEALSEEAPPSLPSSSPPPGIALTQVERDNPIHSVAPLSIATVHTPAQADVVFDSGNEDGPPTVGEDAGARLNALASKALVPHDGVHPTVGPVLGDGCQASAAIASAPCVGINSQWHSPVAPASEAAEAQSTALELNGRHSRGAHGRYGTCDAMVARSPLCQDWWLLGEATPSSEAFDSDVGNHGTAMSPCLCHRRLSLGQASVGFVCFLCPIPNVVPSHWVPRIYVAYHEPKVSSALWAHGFVFLCFVSMYILLLCTYIWLQCIPSVLLGTKGSLL